MLPQIAVVGKVGSQSAYVVFVVIAVVGGCLALVFLVFWLVKRRSTTALVQVIRSRMPAEGTQEPEANGDAAY